MSEIDEGLERLIVRRLDGVADDDEELRLNRELIRNPEARRLMDEYQRVDELASTSLRGAFADPFAFDPMSVGDRPAGGPAWWRRRTTWLWAGAAAAAVLGFAVAQMPLRTDRGSRGPVTVNDSEPLRPAVNGTSVYPGSAENGADLFRNVGTVPSGVPKIRRDTGREVFGVIGEDGNVYWIEVDRTRTVTQPGSELIGRLPPV